MKNIILTGFMGCGKTSVGIRLSYRVRRTMTDTDRKIERLYRMSVSEIFEKMGEEAFRDMETHCLEKLLDEPQGQIIAVGGGLPIRSRNRELLKRLGWVVYLRVKPEQSAASGDGYDKTAFAGRGQGRKSKGADEREGLFLRKRSGHYD